MIRVPKPTVRCAVAGCELDAETRDLCRRHDERARRGFTTTAGVDRVQCLVEGCPRSTVARGLCKLHYEAWRGSGRAPEEVTLLPASTRSPLPGSTDLAGAARYVRALTAGDHAITREVVDARTARLPAIRPSGRPAVPSQWSASRVEGWRQLANCLGLEPGLFYPDRFDGVTTAAAKSVCAGCVVRDRCLIEALEQEERFGVWGGTSEGERRHLRRRLPRWARCAGCGDRYVKVRSGQRYCVGECRALSAKWRRDARRAG